MKVTLRAAKRPPSLLSARSFDLEALPATHHACCAGCAGLPNKGEKS